MKLSKLLRQSFVRAAMDDVPKINYDAEIRKVALAGAVKSMPSDLRRAYEKHPDWFTNDGQHIPGFGYMYLPTASEKKLPEATLEEIKRLVQLKDEQTHRLDQLRIKLRGIADSCTTRKALVEALPEFEKYLPADAPTACRMLPVVANVVADFVAAGWPKDKLAAKVGARKEARA